MRKWISFVLALVLLCTVLPFVTQAAGTGADVTRAQWVHALVETFSMEVEEDNYPDNYFSDLTGEEDYYRDILVAVEFGVVDIPAGMPFQPEAPVTREFAAHTLNYCLGFQLEEGVAYTYNESASVTYPDDIQVAVNRGWFALSDGAFLPEQAVTSAEKTAMLEDAAQVLAGAVVDENYDSSFVFVDEVIVVPENTAGELVAEDKLILIAPDTPIGEGDKLAVTFDGLPTVYQADSVKISGTEYTIQVTKLNLYDYLVSVDAAGVMTGNLADFQVADGLEAIYVLEDETRVASPKAAGSKAIKSIIFNQKFGDVTVAVDLTDMRLEWKANGSVFNKSAIDVSAIVYGKTYCNVSVPFGAKASDFTDMLYLGSYPIGSLGTVSVTANISLDGSITVAYGANFSAGVCYSYAEGFRLHHTFKKTQFSLTVEATLDLSVTAKASIYEVPFLSAQCSVTVGMKANFVARYRGQDQTPALCIHTDSWLYARADASASVGIDSQLPGADNLKKEWSDSLIIWDRNSSPARSISHFEDGEYVTSCSYGETNFFGYDSYYYTGYGSRYANGGVSAVARIPTYTYTTDEDGNATITGFNGGFASISIPSSIDGHPVVAIGDNAFKQHKDLEVVTIPVGVTRIGGAAFYECTGLSNITIPGSVTDIGGKAFFGCVSLVSVDLPDSLGVLGCGAFQDCTGLQRVYIPKDMRCGDYCGANYQYPGPFAGCSKLTTIKFAEGITTIPEALFINCTGLTSVVIPDTVTAINTNAFAYCTNLASVTLSKSQTHIWNNAFGSTALTSVHLPETMEILGCGAFQNCASLQSVYIPKDMNTGDNCGANYQYPGPFANCENLNSVTFEEGITYIPNALFLSCNGLKSITIPDSVVTINYRAFGSCVNLTEVNFSKSLTTIGHSAFADSTALETITLPGALVTIDNYAFSTCTGLTSVELPASLTKLGCGAFQYCSSLKSINIPKNMNTGDNCGSNYQYPGPFKECSSLTDVTFAEGITTMPNCLFWTCTGLESITLPDTMTNISWKAFAECPNLKEVVIPSSVTKIDARAFWASGLLEAKIPDSVTSVGDHVLADCPNLKTIVWPAGTTTIPDYAFAGSVSVESVTLPNTVKTLQKGIFRDCDALKTVALPDSITSIGNELFYDCNSLEEIVIPDSVTGLGSHAFYGCEKLTKVTLSRYLTSIPNSAFQECSILEEVVVPYYVTSIGNNAFNSSPKLAKVVLPRGLESIGSGAFSYANITVIYGVPGTYAETWANENGYQFVAHEVAATEIKLNKTELTLNKGKTEQLVLSVTPVDANDAISWKSSDESVVTVTNKGEVKAVGLGSATIKVVVGNFSANCKVTVLQPVTSINLNKYSVSMESLSTFQLTATVRPDNAANKTIIWTSADPAVATVDENGLVTAVAKGKTTITVEAQDGSNVKQSCTITVTNTGHVVQTPAEMACTEGYPTDCTDFWVYTQTGAQNLEVTFDSKTQLEDGFDYLCIYDGQGNLVGKYTGTELSGKTISVPGDTVKIQLDTDSATDASAEWGFQVTDIKAKETASGGEGGDMGDEKLETVAMHRLFNPNSGEHFYTGSIEERDNLTAAGWVYEGVAWNAPTQTGAPVYRMFNPNNGDHHYTMSWEEVEMLKGYGWQYEGVCWNSVPADMEGAVPLYRLFNPNADCGSHHYTGSVEERDFLVSLGWIYEGIGWYGLR